MRIPEVVLRPRVSLPGPKKTKTTKTTKRRTSPARATTLAERTEGIIADLRARYRKAESEFYAIGKALIELNRPEILALYKVQTFEELVGKHILPYRTAARFMSVAKEYSAETAQMLGVEKAYQLARRAKQLKQNPEAMAKRDAKLGKHRISKLSARDIENLVAAAAMQSGKAKLREPTKEEERSVKAFRADLVEHFDMTARVTIDTKDEMVLIAIPLAEVMEDY